METIKSRVEFERVFSRGKRYNNALLRFRVVPRGEGDCAMVAFVAPKRLGIAVYRNRCKRVLREAARACSLPCDGYDVILYSTDRTHDSSPERVATSLERLLERAGVVRG